MKPMPGPLFAIVGVFLLLAGGVTRAEPPPAAKVDNFIALFQKSQFSAAAQEFHYPPDSTPQQRRDDFVAIVHFLSGLSEVLGKISSIKRGPPIGTSTYLYLGMQAGELPYWSSHHEFDRGVTVSYSIDSEREGDVSIALSYIRPNGEWKIRSISYQYPASRPGAKEHLVALAHKLIPE